MTHYTDEAEVEAAFYPWIYVGLSVVADNEALGSYRDVAGAVEDAPLG